MAESSEEEMQAQPSSARRSKAAPTGKSGRGKAVKSAAYIDDSDAELSASEEEEVKYTLEGKYIDQDDKDQFRLAFSQHVADHFCSYLSLISVSTHFRKSSASRFSRIDSRRCRRSGSASCSLACIALVRTRRLALPARIRPSPPLNVIP